MSEIRLYHSYRSPYSRLGLHKIARAGLDPELIPFTGPPGGVDFYDASTNALKMAYMRQDVPRMTMRMGLAVNPPNPFEVDLAPSYKASVAASAAGVGMAFALAVADARWGEGKNISDIDVLKQCAEAAGWQADAVEAAQTAVSVGKTMKRHREMIEEDKVFGVPFAVRDGSKYWGQDRIDLLVEDAKNAAA